MLSLVKSSIEYVEIEEAIANSDPFFNLVSKDKERFTTEEIAEEITNAINIGAERYLIRHNHEYVGVIEYLLYHPGDQSTWLGLLLIKKEFQAHGYGLKSLQLFEEIMKEKGITAYRIGAVAENTPAHRFWSRNGFVKINSKMNDDHKEFIIYEKNI